MANWIVCPSCNLKHSRRADGLCPRCRESVDRATGATESAAPIEPGGAPPRPASPQPRAWAARPAAGLSAGSDGSWLVRSCRARAVRGFSTAVVLLALGLLMALAQTRYFRNFLGGPFPMSASDLEQISDPTTAPHYFVRVEGARALDTGVEQYEVRTRHGVEVGRTLKARYFALQVGDKFLVVKTAQGPVTVVEGELRRMHPELDQNLFGAAETRALRPRFHPYYLDTASFRSSGYWGIGIGGIFLAVVGVWAGRSWKRMQDPASHPLVQRAAAWGDPAGVSLEIERELQQPWRRSGTLALTDRYIVRSSFYGLDVLRFADLLWAYKKVTKKSVNFVPVGKDFHAVLVCAGGTVEVQGKDAGVDEILEYAAARAPWALFGHSEELQQAFGKDPSGFAAAVAERQRQFEEQAANTKSTPA